MSDKLTKEKVVLLHGVFEDHFFDRFSKNNNGNIFILEGRPFLTSAKANSAELIKRKLKPTVLADNMAGFLFYQNRVKEVWLAYQILDRKGAMCYSGALILGVLAKRHKVPVYLYKGIYQTGMIGKEKDIFQFNGKSVAPSGIKGYVPLIEWLPNKYMTKVVTNGD